MTIFDRSARSLVLPKLGVLAVALALTFPPAGISLAAPSPNPIRVYFPQTGHYLSYGFLDFWRHQGGLQVFGYPITEELTENGRTVQYFERARVEYHPESAGTPYEVELGLVGVQVAQPQGLLNTAPFQPLPATTQSDANCEFYPQTGHRLCFGFKTYWHRHGLQLGDPGVSTRESLALFGYPISEEFQENGVTVQYFERARFEYYPDNPPAYRVLGGLLGNAVARQNGANTAAVPQSQDVPAFNADLWQSERCFTQQLQISQAGASGATGHIQMIYALENTSSTACTVFGYPGMQMVDSAGNPMPTTVVRGNAFTFPDIQPRAVALEPGGQASFAVDYSDVPVGNQTSCPVSAALEITPPNAFDRLVIPASIASCDSVLHVSPVIAGVPGTAGSDLY